jgi:hypothetical protein
MIAKNEHPSAELPTVLDWREVARTSCAKIDWARVAQTALGSALLAGLVGGAMHVIGRVIEAERAPGAESADAEVGTVPDEQAEHGDDDDDGKGTEQRHPFDAAAEASAVPERSDVVEAAELLGVDLDASEDAIRAALRMHLSSSGLHPDQGGDGEQATLLIAAKNLLVERARANRP